MKKPILIITVLGLAWGGYHWRNKVDHAPPAASVGAQSADDRTLARGIASHQNNVAVHGYGVVTRLLPDDTRGIRHQRFAIQIGSGRTLLVAHNIDRAQRVDALKVGDRIEFKGEYEWNPPGGIPPLQPPDRFHEQGAHAPVAHPIDTPQLLIAAGTELTWTTTNVTGRDFVFPAALN